MHDWIIWLSAERKHAWVHSMTIQSVCGWRCFLSWGRAVMLLKTNFWSHVATCCKAEGWNEIRGTTTMNLHHRFIIYWLSKKKKATQSTLSHWLVNIIYWEQTPHWLDVAISICLLFMCDLTANVVDDCSQGMSSCCGLQAFNPVTETCCEDSVVTKPAENATCCGKGRYCSMRWIER